MPIPAILGNERIQEYLRATLEQGKVSHFYLLSGPAGSGKHSLATRMAATILCRAPGKPCGVCPACRKVAQGLHPDVRVWDEPEKKSVSIDLVRAAREDLFLRPNESDYKISIFPRAQDLGVSAQNALLKALEEPPKSGVFLLLANNPEKLLPTVRSRCVELKLSALPDSVLLPALRAEFPDAGETAIRAAAERGGGFLGQCRAILSGAAQREPLADDFAEAFCSRDPHALLEILDPMEKRRRDALIPVLGAWRELLAEALTGKTVDENAGKIAAARSAGEIYAAQEALRRAADYAQSNVSPGAVCGYLEWALR